MNYRPQPARALSVTCKLVRMAEGDVKGRDLTYVQLIAEAIMASSEGRLLLCEIYDWIAAHSFRTGEGDEAQQRRWKNSVRHNLSLNECFEIDPSVPPVPHKGNYWRINAAALCQFRAGNFARRQARQAAARHVREAETGGANEAHAMPLPSLFEARVESGLASVGTLARSSGAAAFSPREVRALRSRGYNLPLGAVLSSSHMTEEAYSDEVISANLLDYQHSCSAWYS